MNDPTVHEPEAAAAGQQFRSQVGHISRQSGAFFAGAIFTAAVGYVFKVYLARVLGAEALGIYALGMTVVGLMGVFGGLGLGWAASRFPAAYCGTGRMEELRSFLAWSVLSLVCVNGVLAFCMVAARRWIASRFYHTPVLAGYLRLFALIMILGALTGFYSQLLTGYKQVARRTVINNVVGGLLTVAFTVALVEMGTGLWGYIFAQVASALVVLAILVWAAHRLTPRAARFWLQPVQPPPREMFSFASAAFAMDIVGFLYSQMDKIVLGFYLNVRSVGIYAVASAIVVFLPLVLQSVNQIFSPTIADLHARGDSQMLNRLFQILTKWILGLTVPLAALVIIFSKVLMRIFGHDFEAGWVILVIGAAGQLVNCAVGSVGFLLLMSGNEKRLVRIQLVMAAITISSLLLLVPWWGIAGAAAAAALGNVGTNMWCLYEVKRLLGLFPYNRSYSRLLLPSAAAVAAAVGLRIALRSISSDVVVVLMAGTAIYFVFLGVVLVIGLEADDKLIGAAIWSRVRRLFPGSAVGMA